MTGLVEPDETSVPYRTKGNPPACRPGRSQEAKLLVAGAVEIAGNRPGRARVRTIAERLRRRRRR